MPHAVQLVAETEYWSAAHLVINPLTYASSSSQEDRVLPKTHWFGRIVSVVQPLLRTIEEIGTICGLPLLPLATSQQRLDAVGVQLRRRVVEAFQAAVQLFPHQRINRAMEPPPLPSMRVRVDVLWPIRSCCIPAKYQQLRAHFERAGEQALLPGMEDLRLLQDQVALTNVELIMRKEFPIELFIRSVDGRVLSQEEQESLDGYLSIMAEKMHIFSPYAYLQLLRAIVYLMQRDDLLYLQRVGSYFINKIRSLDPSMRSLVERRDMTAAEFLATLQQGVRITLPSGSTPTRTIVVGEEIRDFFNEVSAVVFRCHFSEQQKYQNIIFNKNVLLVAADNPLRLIEWLEQLKSYDGSDAGIRLLPAVECCYRDPEFRFALVQAPQYTLDQETWDEHDLKRSEKLLKNIATVVKTAQERQQYIQNPHSIGVLEDCKLVSLVNEQQPQTAPFRLDRIAQWVFALLKEDVVRYSFVLKAAGIDDDHQVQFYQEVMKKSLSGARFSLETSADVHRIASQSARQEAIDLSHRYIRLRDDLCRQQHCTTLTQRAALSEKLVGYLQEHYLFFFVPKQVNLQMSDLS